MNGKLLDTNAVIALQKGVVGMVQLVKSSENVVIPAIVVGELLFGTLNSAQRETNMKVLEKLIDTNPIIPVDVMTSRHYADIRLSLKQKGRPIPENDLWIAAIAIQYGYTLVTADKHFSYVDGLYLESWL